MINGHGGNIYDMARRLGCALSDIVDMSSNVNPLGPPTGVTEFLKKNISAITSLPEVDAKRMLKAFAKRYDLPDDLVLAGNGTTQFIYTIPLALGTRSACILGPAYSDYADACIMNNIPYTYIMAEESSGFRHEINHILREIRGTDTVFICNPNNPTGVLIPSDELETLCNSRPDINFIIDESYLPFVAYGDKESLINRGIPNVILLNSMSKIFRIPGLRVGFLTTSEKLIERLRRYALPWSVNALAQSAVIYLMEQKIETEIFIKETRGFLESERKKLEERLEYASGFRLFPSVTSFILIKLLGNYTAEDVCDTFAQEHILIRNCENFEGLSNQFIRISLKTEGINTVVAEKLLQLR